MGYRSLERSCPKTGWLLDIPVHRIRFLVMVYQKARQTMQHLRHLCVVQNMHLMPFQFSDMSGN